MQSGGYLPSLATVSSHYCTVDEMCMHENLNVSNKRSTGERITVKSCGLYQGFLSRHSCARMRLSVYVTPIFSSV